MRDRLYALLEAGAIGSTDFLVLVCLADYADHGTGRNARPGVSTLAGVCNLSDRSVQRAIQLGRRHGLLALVSRGGGTGPHARPSNYRFLTTDDPAAETPAKSPDEAETGTGAKTQGRTDAGGVTQPRNRKDQRHRQNHNYRGTTGPTVTKIPTWKELRRKKALDTDVQSEQRVVSDPLATQQVKEEQLRARLAAYAYEFGGAVAGDEFSTDEESR